MRVVGLETFVGNVVFFTQRSTQRRRAQPEEEVSSKSNVADGLTLRRVRLVVFSARRKRKVRCVFVQ